MPGITFRTSGALRKSALRQANARLLLNAIRDNPGASRADIARLTGLSPSSVTFVVSRLKREGWLSESKTNSRSQVGRRPTALHLQDDARLAVGVEISQDNPRVILADLKGRIQQTRRLDWNRNPAIFLDKVQAAVRAVIKPIDPDKVLGIGVSIPGDVDPRTGTSIAAENLGWMDVEAGRILQSLLPLPVHCENDANLMALGEKWFGDLRGQPLQHFVTVTMKTGIGTGVILDGHFLHGANWTGGEFGHTMLYADGRPCTCGNRGCWEQYASEKALCRLYDEKGGSPDGEECSAERILAKARDGDPIALAAVRETARNIGLGVVNLVWALNPEAVILGDYVAPDWDLFEDIIWDVIRRRVAPYNLSGLQVVPSKLGADASILGAVALVLMRFFTTFEHDEDATTPGSVSIHSSG